MQAALAAAAQGPRGANPLVGAVVVGTDGTHLATGYHRGAGTAHAEADAIAQAKAAGLDLRGAAIVVTLEPCNHCGRTGPCAQAIIDAGITDVIYAVDDPHDPAAGGAATLRAAGVRVRSGLAADAALELNRRWFDAVAAKRPFVTLHIAQTLDSRIAASDGTSQWISSPESLADNHALRGRIDAILVGTQTVLVDNPRLTARNADGEAAGKQPLRAVMGLPGHSRRRRHPRRRTARSCTWPPAIPREALDAAVRSTASGTSWWKAAPGSSAPSWPPAWSTNSSSTWRRHCSAPAPPPWTTSASPPWPMPSAGNGTRRPAAPSRPSAATSGSTCARRHRHGADPPTRPPPLLHPIQPRTAPARTPPQEAIDVYRNYRRAGKGAVR